MNAIMQLGIILGATFAGEALRALLPLPIPAGVYGLIILLLLLCTGVVRADAIRPAATFLIDAMPLMFVPATVGLMQSWGILRPALVPFVIAITAVTAIVMGVTALIVQKMEGGKKHDGLSE